MSVEGTVPGAKEGGAAADSTKAPQEAQEVQQPRKGVFKCQWNEEMHKGFLAAIFDLGLQKVKPLEILQAWEKHPPGINSEHIKSHLQKYRRNVKRTREAFQAQLEKSILDAQRMNEHANSIPHLHAYPICGSKDCPLGLDSAELEKCKLDEDEKEHGADPPDGAGDDNEKGEYQPIEQVKTEKKVAEAGERIKEEVTQEQEKPSSPTTKRQRMWSTDAIRAHEHHHMHLELEHICMKDPGLCYESSHSLFHRPNCNLHPGQSKQRNGNVQTHPYVCYYPTGYHDSSQLNYYPFPSFPNPGVFYAGELPVIYSQSVNNGFDHEVPNSSGTGHLTRYEPTQSTSSHPDISLCPFESSSSENMFGN